MPADTTRTAGWLPVERIDAQGDPRTAEVLVEALRCSGRVDRLTHGFHTYPAGLHADAAALLLDLVRGDSVLDPFCGGGTVLIEAATRGRRAVGIDVSPIATLVSTGRTRLWDTERISRMRSWGRRITQEARAWEDLPRDPAVLEQRAWYEAHVAVELDGIRRGIHQAPPEVKVGLLMAFSSILIKVSLRESDTVAKRTMVHRDPETTLFLFHKKVRELGRRLEDLAEAVPEGTPEPEILEGDGRSLVPVEPVDAIVTSPPYPAVYDYVPMQALRVAWLGVDDREARRAEISPRRAFRADHTRAVKAWRRDIGAWLKRSVDTLTPGGRMAIVIGDGVSMGERVDALAPLEDEALAAGLKPVARASGERQDHGWRHPRREHILLVERP